MAAFNEALVDCGLTDLGFEGTPFTWTNNQCAPRTIRCRLDRVCMDQQTRARFPTVLVTHVEQPGSDHIPILLRLEKPRSFSIPRSKPFRFEDMWVRQDGCEEIVRRIWEAEGTNGAGGDMVMNGEECRARLAQWSHDLKPDKLIDRLQRRIMELRNGMQTEDVRAEIGALSRELENLFYDLSTYWRQRGKAA